MVEDTMKYEKMLDRLYLSLPEQTKTKERFEMPEVHSHIQGSKTFIKNIQTVLKLVHRETPHFVKFITKELAVPVSVTKEGTIDITGKFSESKIRSLTENYVKQFVLCKECRKPDTKFIEMHGVKMLKCDACGAVTPLKQL